MPYCQDCGAEVADTDAFCSECGADVSDSDDQTVKNDVEYGDIEDSDESVVDTLKPTSRKTAATGVIFGLIIGFLFAWGLTEAGASGIGFLGGFIGGTLYIWNRSTTHDSIASGLFISAIVLVLVPIMFYIPVITGADPDTLEGAGEQIGGTIGLFIWTFVFAIIAGIIGLIGRSIKKRAPEIPS